MKLYELLNILKPNADYIEVCHNDDWDEFDCIAFTNNILLSVMNRRVVAIKPYDSAVRVQLDWGEQDA